MGRLKIMRKFLSIVLFFMILLTMTACHITMTEREREENNSKVDKENISYNFIRDSSLDKYIDKDRNVINVIMQGTITAKISKKGIVVSFSVLHSI